MSKLIVPSFIIFVAIYLSGCASTPDDPDQASFDVEPGISNQARSLIRSADIHIESENTRLAVEGIKEILSKESGYIDNVYDSGEKRTTLTVRVPVKRLEPFVVAISSKGKVVSKAFRVRDVTEEMIDVDARLTNLKVLRERFRELLDKAHEVTDLLKIESELVRIQTDIDRIEARGNALKNQVALSRVDITVTQKIIYGPIGYIGIKLYWLVEKLFVIK